MNNQNKTLRLEEVDQIRSYVESIEHNVNVLDNAMRVQLLSNADQVFHINDQEFLESTKATLKARQETLVSETIRRALGRLKAIQGSVREINRRLSIAFPRER